MANNILQIGTYSMELRDERSCLGRLTVIELRTSVSVLLYLWFRILVHRRNRTLQEGSWEELQ